MIEKMIIDFHVPTQTVRVLDANGNPYPWSENLIEAKIHGPYLKIRNQQGKWSLFNQEAKAMPGARQVDTVDIIGPYGFYIAGNDGYYTLHNKMGAILSRGDNAKKLLKTYSYKSALKDERSHDIKRNKRIKMAKKVLMGLMVFATLGSVSYYGEQKNAAYRATLAAEKNIPATYVRTCIVNGETLLLFDTKTTDAPNYMARVSHVDHGEKVALLKPNETKTLGQWRNEGYFVVSIPEAPNGSHSIFDEKVKQQPARFMGMVHINGSPVLYFDTDKNPNTAEYRSVVRNPQVAARLIHVQKNEERSLGTWQGLGLKLDRVQTRLPGYEKE